MHYSGMKVLVMGLGLHGGGLESARYLARRGAEVTVTDLQDEKTLAPSIEKLEEPAAGGRPAFPFRYVLGRHETADFRRADMIIKNPGVKPGSPYLAAAREAGALIETDISIFLAESPARLLAVTGSKGKSSTASALHWVLAAARGSPEGGGPAPSRPPGTTLPGRAWLGGNITVSPLGFLDRLTADDDVVLELSSWQLGDLRGRCRNGGAAAGAPALLKPRCAVLTAIMPDHLDRYGTMDAYVADKRVIYQGQDREDLTVAGGGKWGESFRRESPGRSLVYAESPLPEGVAGGWLAGPGGPGLARRYDSPPPGTGPITRAPVEVVPSRLLIPGCHQKKNLLAAALALLDLGLPAAFIRESLGRFPGIPHRLEFFHQAGGVRFYNDSAATIPEAAAAALSSFDGPVILVAGGADKDLDFGPLAGAAAGARAIILLAGTAGEKLKDILTGRGIPWRGPFDNLDKAVEAALEAAVPGDTVVLSPGCASFGMFQNEFDRGDKWREAVRRLAGRMEPGPKPLP